MERLKEAGYRLVNLDCIVFAQRPKLSPFKEQLRQNVARAVGIDKADVSIKAKTGEGVGPVGTQTAISAQCIVLIEVDQQRT